MAQITLSQLRTRAKSRSDMLNSTFVADSEWNDFINASADELYDILIQKFGELWNFQRSNVSTVANTDTVALPVSLYRLLSVERNDSGRWMPLDRVAYSGVTPNELSTGRPACYAMAGANVLLWPVPDAVYSLRFSYVPFRTRLVVDADALDGVSGWEEYVVVDAAIKALTKEESDVSALMNDKASLLNRIESAAERRDEGQPRQVVDVEQQGISEFGRYSTWWI